MNVPTSPLLHHATDRVPIAQLERDNLRASDEAQDGAYIAHLLHQFREKNARRDRSIRMLTLLDLKDRAPTLTARSSWPTSTVCASNG
ncbi:MAG: hypothetical protein K0S86_4355 [Geminicoccaceae bacterium]|nr:hypothetical protein [Geminicoccaceae bacterium]